MQETNLSNFDNKIIWFLVYNLSNNVLKYFAFKNMLYAWWDIALYCKVFKHLRKTLIHCFHILYRLNKNYILQYNIYICWNFHSVQTALYLKGNYVLKSIDIKYLFLSNVSQKDIFMISRTWSTHPTIIVLKRWLAAVTFYT